MCAEGLVFVFPHGTNGMRFAELQDFSGGVLSVFVSWGVIHMLPKELFFLFSTGHLTGSNQMCVYVSFM